MDLPKKPKARKLPPHGDGWNNDELFSHAFLQLRTLRKEMENRRSRDRASVALTDAFLAVQALGHRLAAVGPEFDARSPAPVEEEEEERTIPLADVMAAPPTQEEEAIAAEMQLPVADLRVRYFRETLAFMVQGCTQVSDVTRKVLAFVRRVRPEYLKKFGISQADVGRKLGQQRATVSAREKRLVEKPLKANGTRGYKMAGGQKTETHARNCARAQKGNTNRRDGEARKRGIHGIEPEPEPRS